MSRTLNTLPRSDGFRMPAEWEPHIGCWMLWPERHDNWRMGAYPAQHAYAAVANAICKFESVSMGVSANAYEAAREILDPQIRLIEMSSNDAWIRDCGPTFLVHESGEIRGVDWQFNAWGGLIDGLYFPWDKDDLVGEKVLEIERDARYAPEFILEGGSIDVDGEGTLITTEQCLLGHDRNPDLSRTDIETLLKDYLAVEKIIWLGEGVYLDETKGHVDNLCRFIAPGHVVLTWTDDINDPQYAISHDALHRLDLATDANGRKLVVHKLHQPMPILITAEEASGVDSVRGTLPRKAGDRLAASYVNFYIANGAVIIPRFNDPHDHQAFRKLAQLLSSRIIIDIPAREILLGGGNIHCITQQEPLGRRSWQITGAGIASNITRKNVSC
jgi:agmatine deiminase